MAYTLTFNFENKDKEFVVNKIEDVAFLPSRIAKKFFLVESSISFEIEDEGKTKDVDLDYIKQHPSQKYYVCGSN